MSAALTQEQKSTVAQWVSDGASLYEIQQRINSDFGVSITYMDVRFLIDDLGVTPADKTPPSAPQPVVQDAVLAPDDAQGVPPAPLAEDENAAFDANPDAPAPGNVSITFDAVQRPGELASGSVTFSDGQSGQWFLDGSGQLGFEPPYKGYQPSPADVRQFQTQLQKELSKGGY
jgi:hypothetical protein